MPVPNLDNTLQNFDAALRSLAYEILRRHEDGCECLDCVTCREIIADSLS